MLNLFSKSLVASLLAATVAFAASETKCRPQKSFEQGHEVAQNQMMPAYSAPARVEVRGAWDVYATGSFIYWQGRQDNMELGIISTAADALSAATSVNTEVNANYSYKPGFKFGFGVNMDYDNWDAYAEYTWFHGTTTTTTGTLPDGQYLYAGQGNPSYAIDPITTDPYTFTSADESWNLKLDFVDLSLARSFYSGTKLSLRPFFGARGAWIREAATVNYAGTVSNKVATHSVSWGVGPRLGMESNWMCGYGFRLIGDASADILYTRYDLRGRQIMAVTATGAPVLNASLSQKHLDMLRAHADLELGFGWGSYFDNNNWHVDLSATYGYQIFWDQNMTRFFGSYSAVGIAPNGNLYVHGMTLSARLDF